MLSCVQLFSTSWITVACQALLSMEFSRQEYWAEQRHLKFLRKLLSGKAWLAAHLQVYFSSSDKDCIFHLPWQPGMVMWPFWANGSEWGRCSVFMSGLAHVILPLLGNHHGRTTKGRSLGHCIASWTIAAHPSRTPILPWWIRRCKLEWYKATESWVFVTKTCYHLNTSAASFLVLIMQDKVHRSQCLHSGFLWRLKLRKERNGSSQMIVFVEVGPWSLLMEPSLYERLGFWSQSTKRKFGFHVDKTTKTRKKKKSARMTLGVRDI